MSRVEERGGEIVFKILKTICKKEKKRERKFTLEATSLRSKVDCKLSQA